MLIITVPEQEFYNEAINEFVTVEKTVLRLEHSLVSISKWEAKYHRSFINKKTMTADELRYYVQCMTLSNKVEPKVYLALSRENYKQILDYIQDPMTATTFRNDGNGPGSRSNEAITSELIYYWMVSLGIPFECQYWHLNRLLTLIRVCNVKNAPSKKMSKSSIMRQNTSLNAARRQAMRSRG